MTAASGYNHTYPLYIKQRTATMALDLATVKLVAADINASLVAIGLKHGMMIQMSGGSYDEVEGTFRSSITALKVSAAEVGDKRLAGCKPKDIANAKQLGYFGKTVTYFGLDYEIVGHNGYVLLGWDPRKERGVRLNQKQTAEVMPQLRGQPAAKTLTPATPPTKKFTPAPLGTATLAKFIAEENVMAAAFGRKSYDVNNLSAQDKKELADSLGGKLSPENLSCDGEASRSHVIQRGGFLRTAAAELVAIGGPKATY
jgi:hypothetical protein